MKTNEENCLRIGKMKPEDSILRICIDSDTDHWVKLQYNGKVIYEDKSEFKKAAVVFWNAFRINGLPVSKYNRCPNLEFRFKDGLINQLEDGRLICESIPPITYEMFYYIAEEYKRIVKR